MILINRKIKNLLTLRISIWNDKFFLGGLGGKPTREGKFRIQLLLFDFIVSGNFHFVEFPVHIVTNITTLDGSGVLREQFLVKLHA